MKKEENVRTSSRGFTALLTSQVISVAFYVIVSVKRPTNFAQRL